MEEGRDSFGSSSKFYFCS